MMISNRLFALSERWEDDHQLSWLFWPAFLAEVAACLFATVGL